MRIVRQLVHRSFVQHERAERHALERRAEALLGDAVAVRNEPVVGLGEELAASSAALIVSVTRSAPLGLRKDARRRVVSPIEPTTSPWKCVHIRQSTPCSQPRSRVRVHVHAVSVPGPATIYGAHGARIS